MMWVELLVTVGGVVALGGFLVEAVAVTAMGSYRLRRRLPVRSPIHLAGIGGCALVGGLLCSLFGEWLRPEPW